MEGRRQNSRRNGGTFKEENAPVPRVSSVLSALSTFERNTAPREFCPPLETNERERRYELYIASVAHQQS